MPQKLGGEDDAQADDEAPENDLGVPMLTNLPGSIVDDVGDKADSVEGSPDTNADEDEVADA